MQQSAQGGDTLVVHGNGGTLTVHGNGGRLTVHGRGDTLTVPGRGDTLVVHGHGSRRRRVLGGGRGALRGGRGETGGDLGGRGGPHQQGGIDGEAAAPLQGGGQLGDDQGVQSQRLKRTVARVLAQHMHERVPHMTTHQLVIPSTGRPCGDHGTDLRHLVGRPGPGHPSRRGRVGRCG